MRGQGLGFGVGVQGFWRRGWGSVSKFVFLVWGVGLRAQGSEVRGYGAGTTRVPGSLETAAP